MLRRFLAPEIRFVCKVPEKAGYLRGRPSLIDQTVINLCLNARDAMPAGGLLRITTVTGRFRQSPDGVAVRAIRLRVADNGHGMEPAVQARAFDPFFTTKPQGRGLGLGLANVREVVALYHGWIEMRSRVGRGTRFDLFFPTPTNVRRPRTPRTALMINPFAAGKRVLVVENDPTIRRLMIAGLRRFGLQVASRSSLSRALPLLRDRRIRLDAVLYKEGPSMESIVPKIRELRPRVPIIVATDGDDRPRGAGVTALPRPFLAADLAAVLGRII